MRSVRRWPLGENLPTSLSIPLEISPYSREVVVYFRVKGSRQIKGPKKVNYESEVDRKGVRTRL